MAIINKKHRRGERKRCYERIAEDDSSQSRNALFFFKKQCDNFDYLVYWNYRNKFLT